MPNQEQRPLILSSAKSYGKIIYTDLAKRKMIDYCVNNGALSNVKVV